MAKLDVTGASTDECQSANSGGIDYCLGYVKSCPDGDTCCPPESWYSSIYRAVMGNEAAQGMAEQRTAYALGLLLKPASGSPTGTGIDEFAWDNQASVKPGLSQSVIAASFYYQLAFPFERWTWNDSKRSGEEYGCDVRWGGFNENLLWPAWRFEAVEKLSGVQLTSALRTRLATLGASEETKVPFPGAPSGAQKPAANPLPAELAKWFRDAEALFRAVPVGAADYVETKPKIENLLAKSGATISASPWLDQFVVFFTPKGAKMTTGPAKGGSFGSKKQVQATAARPGLGTPTVPTQGPQVAGPGILIAGGLALGVLLLLRK